jgi:hypothetical protein
MPKLQMYAMRGHQENEESYQNHFTCICLLFGAAAMCCFGGYSNILTPLPAISLYTPIPLYSIVRIGERWYNHNFKM